MEDKSIPMRDGEALWQWSEPMTTHHVKELLPVLICLIGFCKKINKMRDFRYSPTSRGFEVKVMGQLSE